MRVAKQVSIKTLFAMVVGGTGTRRCPLWRDTLDGGARLVRRTLSPCYLPGRVCKSAISH